MKEKIILFAVGLLMGTILTTGAFCIYNLTIKTCDITSQRVEFNKDGSLIKEHRGKLEESNDENTTKEESKKKKNTSESTEESTT